MIPNWRDEPPRTDTGYVEDPATPDHAARLSFMLDRFPRSWVTFRERPQIDFDKPYSNFFTPQAVYGLDSGVIAAWADRFVTSPASQREGALFHTVGYTRRPRLVIFSIEGEVLSNGSSHRFPDIWEKLQAQVSGSEAARLVMERWAPRRSYAIDETFRAIMYMTEQCADALTGAERFGDSFTQHPDKPRVWRDLFLSIGIDAVEDRGGFLTGDCGPQAAVFNLDAMRILGRAVNPAGATRAELQPEAALVPAM